MKRLFTSTLLTLALVACGQQPAPVLEPEDTTQLEDTVTASRTFTLSSIRPSSSIESLDLPAGLQLTVQLVTTTSGKKKGNRYTRVKLTNSSSVDIPVPALVIRLEIRPGNAVLSQSVSKTLKTIPVGKTAYRSAKSVNISSLNITYAQLYGYVMFEGITTPQPLEVCEAGSAAPGTATAETARAALEPLATQVNRVPGVGEFATPWAWSSSTNSATPSQGQTVQTLETWAAGQTSSAGLSAFVLELKRQFPGGVSVVTEEIPCQNCHEWAVSIVGLAAWGTGTFSSSYGWDS